MKYLWRLGVWFAIFFLTLSVGYVLIMRFVPVTITPLKVVKLFENSPDVPFRVHSRWVGLHGINPVMAEAVIASEDNFFLVHRGFDWKSIRLAIEERRRGGRRRGASTISQQTAKNVFCYPSSSWFRKGVETYYTVLIEALWGKRRIMETYLNIIELGPNVYGVGEASRRYLKKEPDKLNAYDASLIAAVLPNPIRLKLSAPSSYLVRRAATIRGLMRNSAKADFENREELRKQYKKYRTKKDNDNAT